jgi:hypothetical protein
MTDKKQNNVRHINTIEREYACKRRQPTEQHIRRNIVTLRDPNERRLIPFTLDDDDDDDDEPPPTTPFEPEPEPVLVPERNVLTPDADDGDIPPRLRIPPAIPALPLLTVLIPKRIATDVIDMITSIHEINITG